MRCWERVEESCGEESVSRRGCDDVVYECVSVCARKDETEDVTIGQHVAGLNLQKNRLSA